MSNALGGKRRNDEPQDTTQADGDAGGNGQLHRLFREKRQAEADAQAVVDNQNRVTQSATDKSNAVRNSGQATGSVETSQSDGPGPLPGESSSSQGGDTGQNIAPTKKRGAFRAAVGGANSIRI